MDKGSLLQLIVAVDGVKVVRAVVLPAGILDANQLKARDAAPARPVSEQDQRCQNFADGFPSSPVLPRPAAVLVDLDPAAAADFSLGNLLLGGLADRVLAASPVVGRDFCAPEVSISRAGVDDVTAAGERPRQAGRQAGKPPEQRLSEADIPIRYGMATRYQAKSWQRENCKCRWRGVEADPSSCAWLCRTASVELQLELQALQAPRHKRRDAWFDRPSV